VSVLPYPSLLSGSSILQAKEGPFNYQIGVTSCWQDTISCFGEKAHSPL
jgi:hypothetical protein